MSGRSAVSVAACLATLVCTFPAQAQEGLPRLEGLVLDAAGKPLVGARVSIATAGVRSGISPY